MTSSSTVSRSSPRSALRTCAFLLLLFAALLVSSPSSAQTNWQREWERTVAAAEKEGQIHVAGPPGDLYRQAFVDVFQKRHPKIRVEYNGASGRDQVPRIARERQAGVFNWDVYIGGPTSALEGLKPAGAFDPIRPELLLPEVLDDAKWYGGFHFGFVVEKDEKLFYAFDGTASDAVHVNWDFVPPGELKTIHDLLDPKWAGKIVWEDPRRHSSGTLSALRFSLSYGEEFLRKLLKEQKIAFTQDRRQIVEWLVRGRYPVAVSLPEELLKAYQEKGAGKNIRPLQDSTLVHAIVPGFGALGIFNRRPYPNATRVYLNWLLSREGQTSYASTVGRNSRRFDVIPGDPQNALDPKKKYLMTQTEEALPQHQAIINLAKESIP